MFSSKNLYQEIQLIICEYANKPKLAFVNFVIMKDEIGGIIICGGKSTRFGTDKGSYLLGNKEMIKYSIDLLKKFTKQIIIVGKKTINDNSVKFVNDIFENSGPMGGIHSGLIHSNFENNLVLPCDSPFVKENTVQKLFDKKIPHNICIFQTPDKRYHPLLGLYSRQIINELELHLKANETKLIKFILKQNHKIIKLNEQENLDSFININYRNDASKYEQKL